MRDRLRPEFIPSGPLTVSGGPLTAVSAPVTAFAILVGVCSLRPGEWPAIQLPSWLDLHGVFALALCASAVARLRGLLPRRESTDWGARQALRRLSRQLYSTIYWVIGISGSIDLAGTTATGHPSASSLFDPAALALGRLGPSRNLQLLIVYGIGTLVVTRLGAALWLRKIRTFAGTSAPHAAAAPRA